MKSEVYWITTPLQGRLAIIPRPRGADWLEDEIISLKRLGITAIVSFLELMEARSLGLELEENYCAQHGLEFLSFPIKDRSVPDSSMQALQFFSSLYERLEQRQSLAVHCRAGIGRSGITAVSLLIMSGIAVQEAFSTVSAARGFEVPDTQEQREWVEGLATRLRNQGG